MSIRVASTAFATLAVAAAAWANGPTGAAKFGVVSQGVLVPGVFYSSAQDTSAVGVTSLCPSAEVYWAFADQNDQVLDRGRFHLPQAQTRAFVLAQELGTEAAGRFGTLAFVADANGDGELRTDDAPCLVAEAFHANLASQDAVYIPVWPFNASDIRGLPMLPPPPDGIEHLSALDPNMLTTLHSGIVDPPGPGSNLVMARYSITGEDSTQLVVWSADDLSGSYQVDVSHANGTVGSVTLQLTHPHLNVIDVGSIPGFPANFTNGLLAAGIPDDADGDYVDLHFDGTGLAVYTVIHSPALGAAQTILATAGQ